MEKLSEWFWADRFWLPAGVSFKDLEDKPGFHFPKARDLLMMPIYAIGILCIRYIFESFVTNPLAKRLGIVDRPRKKPSPNSGLEALYRISKHPSHEQIKEHSKHSGMSEKGIQRWLRRKRNTARPLLTKKMAEACWRGTFYTLAFMYGMTILYQSSWFWDNLYCWVDYPFQTLWPSVYYYYMIEGGFYISLLFSIFKDVKRKDFTEQLIHHLATIFLIVFSYCANFVRIGTMVMAIHDVSDIVLEYAKCFVYAKINTVGDHLFTLFAIIFIISRLIVYPYCVLHTTWVKSMWLYQPYTGYYFFNALLMILQLLHIFWAGIIIKMAVKLLLVGKVEKDDRSDVEEFTTDDEEENKKVD